jgi:hypothetical protein
VLASDLRETWSWQAAGTGDRAFTRRPGCTPA